MSQRGPSAGYGLSGPSYGGPAPVEESSGNILDQIRPYTSKVEDMLDNLSEPIKPYVASPVLTCWLEEAFGSLCPKDRGQVSRC